MSNRQEKYKQIISKTIIPLQDDVFISHLIGKNKIFKIEPSNPEINLQFKNDMKYFDDEDETNLNILGDKYYEYILLVAKTDLVVYEIMKKLVNIYHDHSEFLYFYKLFKFLNKKNVVLNNWEYWAISNKDIIFEKANIKNNDIKKIEKVFNITINYRNIYSYDFLEKPSKYTNSEKSKLNLIAKIFGSYRGDTLIDYTKLLLSINDIIAQSQFGSNFIIYFKIRNINFIFDLITSYSSCFQNVYIYCDRYALHKNHFTLALINKNKEYMVPKINDPYIYKLYNESVLSKYTHILNFIYDTENNTRGIIISILQLKFYQEDYYNLVIDKLNHIRHFINMKVETILNKKD